MKNTDLLVTMLPSFPHFERFVADPRVAAIRINSAMTSSSELEEELEIVRRLGTDKPLYYDVKGRQLRIEEVHDNPGYLDITLNHPIDVATPTQVLFKAGEDGAELDHVEEGGKRLVFRGGPDYMVKPGESLHIKDPSLRVRGPQFTDLELAKIERVAQAGFKRFFLSFVKSQEDVDEFLSLVGNDAEVWLKIEDQQGLDYVANEFVKRPNLTLVAARGDLYVEVDRPHDIVSAMQLIISKDPEACVGSRMLLSVCQPLLADFKRAMITLREEGLNDDALARIDEILMDPKVPSCADFHELAWLYDIGYRKMMLCDELCLKEDLLATAVNAFDAFKQDYPAKPEIALSP